MTGVEKMIASIENELESAWQLPLSGGKVLVDAKEIMKIIQEAKENLPMEIVQAKKIIQDRSEIISKAKAEGETLLRNSEEKVKQLVSQSEIVKVAEAKAQNILSEANAKARDLKTSSDEYASNIMRELDEAVTESLTQIRKVRSMLDKNKQQG